MVRAVVGLLALLSPDRLWACAVCFGNGDNADLSRAYSIGIFVLMGFTFLIMGALGFAVYRIEARRAGPDDPPDDRPPTPQSPAPLRGSPVCAP